MSCIHEIDTVGPVCPHTNLAQRAYQALPHEAAPCWSSPPMSPSELGFFVQRHRLKPPLIEVSGFNAPCHALLGIAVASLSVSGLGDSQNAGAPGPKSFSVALKGEWLLRD